MMARTLADAFIRLRPETSQFARGIERAGREAVDDLQDKLRRMHLPIPNVEISTDDAARDIKVIENELRDLARQSPDVEVDVNVAAALREIKTFKTRLGGDAEDAGESAGRRATQGFNNKFDIGGALFTKVAAVMASRMVLIGAAVSGMAAVAAPAIGSLVQSLVHLSGMAAAVPALLVAGGASFAVLKIGTEGFFDAIKAGGDSLDDLKDAVAGMPKGMADTAIAIDSFRERYEAMQTAIQTNLFTGLAEPVKKLGNELFPALEKHLPAIASSFNVMAENVLRGAVAGGVLKQGLHDALDSTAVGLAHANNNVGSLVTAFGKFLSIGAPFIERLGKAIDNMVFRLAQFINTSSDARITGWIEKSILVARQLGSIVASTFSIIGSLVRAAGHDGESFLGVVARLAAQFAAFLKTTEGQSQIRQFFDTVKGAVNGVGAVFSVVWPSIKAAGVALLPALEPLARVFGEILMAVAPLLPHFVGLGTYILTAFLPVIQAAAQFFREHETAAKVLGTTLAALFLIIKTYAVVAAAATFATSFWAAATGVQTVATNTSTAALAGHRLGIIAHTIASGIARVATLTWAAAMWVLNAALSPIGLIVIAVIAVIGLLVFGIIKLWQHNETFRNIVTGAWNGIKAAAEAVVNWFVTVAWPFLQSVWNGIAAGAVWLWQNAILPAFNGIRAAVEAAWGWIVNTGWPALQAVFTAIGAVVGWLWNNIIVPAFNGWRAVVEAAWGWITTTGWPALQSVFTAIGAVLGWLWNNVVVPAFNGWRITIQAAWGWITSTGWPALQSVFTAIGTVVSWLWNNVVVPAFNGWRAVISAAWGWITTTGWPALQAVFTAVGTIVNWLWNNVVVPAFNGWRATIQAAWGWVTTTGWPALKAAFEAVGVVVNWLWNNVVVPAFRGIKAAFETAATVARNLWNFLGPIIGQIGTVVLWLWNNAVVPAFRGIKAAFETAATVARNLWNFLGPIIGQIGTVVLWLWNNVVVPAFRGIKAAFETAATVARNLWGVIGPVLGQVATVVLWLWNNVVVPAFRGIKTAVELAWGWIVNTGWPFLRDAFNRVKETVSILWEEFKERFNAIRDKVVDVVNYFLFTLVPKVRDTFNNVKQFVTDLWNGFREKFDQIRDKVTTIMDGVKRAFEDTKNAIKTTWEKIKEAVRTPINYVINPVYAKIKDFWNAIVSKVGLDGLKLPDIAQMASGGIYPGYTPGRDIGFAAVSGGEAIMRPEWTRAVGPAWVDRANKAARTGGVSGAARFMGGYADGGLIPGPLRDVGGWLKGKGEEFALGSLLRIAEPIIKGIRGLIDGIPGEGTMKQVAKALPTKLLDSAIEWIKSKDVAPELGGEGGSLGTGGASIDKIIGLAKASKIPFNVTSTYRPGDPLYHGSKRAVDFGGYNQDKFATFWMGMRSSLLELIHRTNSKDYGVSNGRVYAAGSNSGLLNEHRNHVHVAMNGNAVIGGGGGGGGGGVSGMVAGWIRTALAREGVANWQAWMETLVKRESGGNRFAQSFSSNGALGYAIGLAQLLSGTFAQFRDKSLPNDRTDPIANLVASIRYIKRRYGSIFSVGHANPNGRADPGGYAMGGVVRRFDKGGMVRPGEFMFNGGRVPELATPTDQPIRLHPKDLKMLGEIIGSQVVRAIGTFGSVTARSADLLARS